MSVAPEGVDVPAPDGTWSFSRPAKAGAAAAVGAAAIATASVVADPPPPPMAARALPDTSSWKRTRWSLNEREQQGIPRNTKKRRARVVAWLASEACVILFKTGAASIFIQANASRV